MDYLNEMECCIREIADYLKNDEVLDTNKISKSITDLADYFTVFKLHFKEMYRNTQSEIPFTATSEYADMTYEIKRFSMLADTFRSLLYAKKNIELDKFNLTPKVIENLKRKGITNAFELYTYRSDLKELVKLEGFGPDSLRQIRSFFTDFQLTFNLSKDIKEDKKNGNDILFHHLPYNIFTTLRNHKIFTVNQLLKYQANPEKLLELKGIGGKKYQKILDFFEKLETTE